MRIDFRESDPALSPARDLIAAMVAEMNELYGDIEGPNVPSATPADFAQPHGTFLVGYDDGKPVCAGGLKRLDEQAAEIKRMYVAPAARRRGVARALLDALEDAARMRGYAVVRLDTGPKQASARQLYERAGYASVQDYNGNPYAAFWGEKRLDQT
jgi:GNAT superfamily N-acetyltransferase